MANEAEQMLPFDAVNAASDIVEFLDDKNVEAVVVKMKQIVLKVHKQLLDIQTQ